MQPLLLATKIGIPPKRERWVQRPRLIELLEANVLDYPLTIVSAPAGYGKTTLISQWAHERQTTNIAWVLLESTDSDPLQFVRYLVSAWDLVRPGVLDSTVGLLAGSSSPDLDGLLTQFINVASGSDADLVFVLDDVHLIESLQVLQALTFLIDHLPANVHIVATCRGEPGLPMARYRARGSVFEIDAAELAFDLDEATQLLDRLASNLSADQIARAHERVSGWAAGLQLVGLAEKRGSGRVLATSGIGGQRQMADYIRQEVIDHLPPAQRTFILKTSMLTQLSADLCDHVIEQSGSQAHLEAIEREGLFLQPLDHSRTWYRYLPAFAAVLRDTLESEFPQDVPELHKRAARWHSDHQMPEQSFGHAVAGEDFDTLTELFENYVVIKLESGEMHTVEQWVSQIPDSWYEDYPPLAMLKIPWLIYSGAIEEGTRLLDETERAVKSIGKESTRRLLGTISTARCAIACFLNDLPMAESYAREALRDLPPEEQFFRASVFHALGETYARNAHWSKATELLRKSLEIRHEPSYLIRSAHIYGALADLELRKGNLEIAGNYWQQALDVILSSQTWGRLPIPVTGWVNVRMAELLYEQNELEEVGPLLERGLSLAELGGEPRTLIAGHLLSARICLHNGNPSEAETHLEVAGRILDQTRFDEWSARFQQLQIEMWRAQNRLRAVVEWADRARLCEPGPGDAEREIDQLVLGRALIIMGGESNVTEALAIIRDAGQAAAEQDRQGIRIEAFALEALARWDGGDKPGALVAIDHALRLASDLGFIRLIADYGPPMALILREAKARKAMSAHAMQILMACGDTDDSDRPGVLVDPLSDREQQVLALLAAGLTNAEIGANLFISPETVKKHTSSIYAKLAVRGRTEAVVRARELALFDA